ncbi:2OG-Fe(II) oxygenase [uncultured Roseobacter sp.]|uniref:2OG-Fe(II) oxygenase n=1 Tax=uncultured Roseobacter sp. TaxID=114847 RepID=UPI002639D6A7|nr:2OG-Fe(II) oxygenase [uncultured Roseobacter sp.]
MTQTPAYPIDAETLLTPTDAARALGKSHAGVYQSGEPYHHICIDNFLPESILERVCRDLENMPAAEASFSRAQENLKSSYIPERLPEFTRNLFYAFNSRPFILFLEEMTGIRGLIPDPYYNGAGIHKTLNGGHLDIHADFNLHKQMGVERRLNVLIYLNKNWQEDWGGSFEIWDNDMTRKMASFVPTFNRMVCFSTGSDTFHGNPEPVNHPDGEARQSIALYYYTATWDDTRKEHTTLFRPRPGSADQTDRLVARRAMVKDILPPAIYRRIGSKLRRLGL